MKRDTSASPIVDLAKARRERPDKLPNGKPCPPWTTYTPPPLYQVHPCEIIPLPAKRSGGDKN